MKLKLLAAAILFSFSSLSSGEGLQEQLDDTYLQMSNYTQPGSFETMRRGGWQGGRFTIKQGIVRNNIVNLQLPSARGGCGGIDIFGGSFSFINSDQIVETFRAVAANAEGYLFSIALSAVCSNCMEEMKSLQQKVQDLNANMLDSCQLAQGLVTNTLASAKGESNWSGLWDATGGGLASDIGEVAHGIWDSRTAFGRQNAADPAATADKYLGAVLYKEMKRHSWAATVKDGDNTLAETIMSIVGSPHYIASTAADKTSTDQGDKPVSRPLPKLKSASDLISVLLSETTQELEIYNCASDTSGNCIIGDTGQTRKVEITGFVGKIREVYLGDNGLITNIKLGNSAESYDTAHQNVLASMPSNMTAMVVNLANCDPKVAEQFVKENLPVIALYYTDNIITQLLRSVHVLSAKNTTADKNELVKFVRAADKDWSDEFNKHILANGKVSDLYGKFDEKMRIVRAGCPELHQTYKDKMEKM